MPQTVLPDPEVGSVPGGPADFHPDNPTTTSNQQLQGESNFGDSSEALFTLYFKAAEEEDKKMVERWQKDADGILIFTGLFSASVAALLSVTVQDLRPNSQDTSAFYLGNIYQVLADPNVTRSSTPPVVTPPSFSPSRFSVLVNSLWFLSLVMSVSCALWATLLQRWARRYLRQAHPAWCHPDKRARMRAFFAEGMNKMHIPWAVEGLPTLLHLSLFLFFGGLAIFLFNINREVFCYVVWWIGLFSVVYGIITLLPSTQQNSPYNSPYSKPAWFLHTTLTYVTVEILRFIIRFFSWIYLPVCLCSSRMYDIVHRVLDPIDELREYYRQRMLGGVEKAVEETVSRQSSKIDHQILDWTVSALGDDDSMKSFFEAIPGFYESELVKNPEIDFPEKLAIKFRNAFGGFLRRTWRSNSVNYSEKIRRLDICLNAIKRITYKTPHQFITRDVLSILQKEVPQTVKMGHILARWIINDDRGTLEVVQRIVAKILVHVQKRNDSWVALAAGVFGIPEQDLRDNIARGDDSVLLVILIHVTRQYLHSGFDKTVLVSEAVFTLSQLDIHNTLPRLQHDFCTLWNEIVIEAIARNQEPGRIPVGAIILNMIRHPYIDLHPGTHAAIKLFIVDVKKGLDQIPPQPLQPSLSYPLCKIAGHHPLPTPANSPDALSLPPTDGNIASRQNDEIGSISHAPDMTPPPHPVHSSSRPLGSSPIVPVAAAPQDITLTATFSPHLEGSAHHDSGTLAPSAEPGTTASTHVPTPALAPIPTSLSGTSESYDPGIASVSNPSHLTPSIGSSIPTSHPTDCVTLLRLRPRGLVNTRNICFTNAILQLLVYSPPFWNLFGELGDLKAQRGTEVPESGGSSATPLIDATVRFFKEFFVEEELPSTQQQSQPATGGTSRAGEEKKDDNIADSFEPTYMYDAMKEKRQLKPLLDGQQQDAEEFLCLYLDALDEELPALLASISGRQSAGAALEVEKREVSQSGQTEVGCQGFMANFVESPVTRIFGGKLCSHVRTSNKPDVVTKEDWRSLHLNIQYDSIRTVQDALAHISQPQSVQVSATGGLGDSSRQVVIEALPPVLVLHLNRVRYDAAAGGITKIAKTIQLAPELEIPLDIMVPTAQRPSEPPHYKLYGVLYHHGESASSGHYTVDVLQPNGDDNTGEVWLHIDNEVVIPVRHEDVFGGHGTEQAADEGCAYLLFYCRTSR